jgi:plastocyanin
MLGGRYMLLFGVLCAVCSASVAIAFATPRHAPPRRSSAARKACRHTERRHCPLRNSEKGSRHKHRSRTNAKLSKPTTKDLTPDTSGSVDSPSVTPESTAGSSPAHPGETEKAIPVKTPAAPAPAAPTHVEVTAEDSEGFRFVLSRPSVPAGKTIIEFVNHGQDEHNLNAAEESEGTVVGSLPNTAANGHLSLTVDLKPGSYTLLCSLPGHAAKGMKATLVVE